MTGAGQVCGVCNDTGIITDTTDGEWACYVCRAASEITYSYSRQDVESLCAIAVAASQVALLLEVEGLRKAASALVGNSHVYESDNGFTRHCVDEDDLDALKAALSPASGGV